LRGNYNKLADIDFLTIGGSTTNLLYIDDDKTWQEEIRKNFLAGGKQVTVVNAGVDGHSTFGHIATFDKWFPLIPYLKAKYVIAYIGINDKGLKDENKYDTMQAPSLLKRARYYVLNNSALYYLFRTVRGMLRANDAKLIHGASSFHSVEWTEAFDRGASFRTPNRYVEMLNKYRARVRFLIKKIRAFGAVPILVTQPTASYRFKDGKVLVPKNNDGEPMPDGYISIMSYNAATMEECETAKAICLDLANEVTFEVMDYYDGIHMTPEGNKKVGNFLYKKLKDKTLTALASDSKVAQ
jgi:lysophospholipase L1-like esterase